MQHFLLKCLHSSCLLVLLCILSSFKSWCSPNFSSFYILENKLHEGTVTITWTPGEKGTLWHYLMDQPKALPLYAVPHPFLYLTMTGFVFSILPTYFQKFAPGYYVDTSKLTHSTLKSWLSFLPASSLVPFRVAWLLVTIHTIIFLVTHLKVLTSLYLVFPFVHFIYVCQN